MDRAKLPRVVTSASSFDPDVDEAVSLGTVGEHRLGELLDWVTSRRSGRGLPAIEFLRPDGASLTLGTDGSRAALVWIDSLGESRSCLGGEQGESLVYDCFGSWTEVAAENTVPLDVALECTRQFLSSGIPETPDVLFQMD